MLQYYCMNCTLFVKLWFVLYKTRCCSTPLPKFQTFESDAGCCAVVCAIDWPYPFMQSTMDEICASAWKISALLSVAAHPLIYDSNMHSLPDLGGLCTCLGSRTIPNHAPQKGYHEKRKFSFVYYAKENWTSAKRACDCRPAWYSLFLAYQRLQRCLLVTVWMASQYHVRA